MKQLKHFHVASALFILLLSFLAFKGFFVGMDLLPIVIGGVFIVIGLIVLLMKKGTYLKYRIWTFAAMTVSALVLNHVHFNVYSAKRKAQSEQNSIALLKGHQAPSITFLHQLNSTKELDFSEYIGEQQYTILNFWGTWSTMSQRNAFTG